MAEPLARHRGVDLRRTVLQVVRGVGYLVLGGFIVVGMAQSSSAVDHPAALVFLLLVLLVCVVGLAWVVLELWHVRHRPGPRLDRTPDGTPAVLVAVTRWLPVLGVSFGVGLACALLTWAVLALGAGHPVGGGLLALAGLFFLVSAGQVLVGTDSARGVYLTAAGVEHRVSADWWRVAWDDLAAAVPGEPLVLVLRDDATVERRRPRRGRRPERMLPIQTRYLAVDGALLGYAMLTYLVDPALRRDLGTADSLRGHALPRHAEEGGRQ